MSWKIKSIVVSLQLLSNRIILRKFGGIILINTKQLILKIFVALWQPSQLENVKIFNAAISYNGSASVIFVYFVEIPICNLFIENDILGRVFNSHKILAFRKKYRNSSPL